MKTKLILLILMITSISFGQKKSIPCSDDGTSGNRIINRASDCTRNEDIYIDEIRHQDHWIPQTSDKVKTLKYRIHFIQKDDGTGNFTDIPETYTRFNQVNLWLNGFYSNVDDHSMYIAGVEDIDDTQIQFELVGIHFYQNTAMYFSNNTVELENYISTYYPEVDDVFHVFIGSDHPYGYSYFPSLGDITSPGHSIYTPMNDPDNIYDYFKAQHLAHEFGHSLGLRHIYSHEFCHIDDLDFLSDVFIPDFPGTTPSGSCDVAYYPASCDLGTDAYCSNDLMSGKALTSYYVSPLQIGRMHRVTHLNETREFIWGYSNTPYLITEDQTWDFSIKMYEDIVIKSGNTLTVTCEIQMVPQAKIVVEPGAKLIVDGGTITIAKRSNELWQGIEVWGNSDSSQTYADQGWVILKDATISYAHVGVSMWRPGFWDQTGGVIQAYNSTFKNNRRDVAFMNYTDETDTGLDKPNKSLFRNVDFIWDNDFNHTPLNHVSLYKVSGVRFGGCHFSDDRTGDNFTSPYLDNGGSITKCGIRSVDAKYYVNAICGSLDPLDCTGDIESEPWNPSTFNNLDFGIYASNLSTIYPITVNKSIFTNNLYGVETVGLFSPKIIHNKFIYSFLENYYIETNKYGIHLLRSQDIIVEENEFKNITPYESIGTTIGIVSSDLGQNNEMIRKNAFKGLTYGNITQGENRGALWPLPNGSLGLSFECNVNQYNLTDFRVLNTLWGDFGAFYGVKTKIGSYEQPAGNTFTEEFTNNFINNTTHLLKYYHKEGEINQEPIFTSNVNKVSTTFEVSCESNFQFINEIGIMENQFFQVKSQLDQLLYTYEQQINQGNPSLQLENKIINLQSQKSKLGTSILSTLYNVNEFNDVEIKNWIILDEDVLYKTRLIDLYIQQLDLTEASNEINNLSNALTTYSQQFQVEILDFIKLKQIQISILSQGKTFYDFSENDKIRIHKIADNGKGLAKYQAQEILCFFYNQCITQDLLIPQGSTQSFNRNTKISLNENDLSVYPNPTVNKTTIFIKNANLYDSYQVEIYNIQGRKLKAFEMKGQKFQFDISEFSNGIYLVKVFNNKNSYSTKLLKI